MANERVDPVLIAAPANAGAASPGQRSDPANSAASLLADDEADPHDISKILMGAQATTGKAVLAAGRMTVNADSVDARRQAQTEQQKRDAQQAREMANLAAWNSKTTTVGGVQMTNEQAQRARQNVINNGDAYADWAVRKGLIKEDEKDAFKTGIRRKMELEDKRGRGTLTTAEAAEEAQLDRSRVGKALDAATAQNFQNRGALPQLSNSAATREANADSSIRGTASVLDRSPLFQSAPPVADAFTTASAGEAEKKVAVAPTVAPSIKATGLDL